MPIDAGIVCEPWNERDAGGLLERAAGEAGLDHVTIVAVSGPIAQVRFVDDASRWFDDDGGWHYRPAVEHYAATRFRPRAARWLASDDRLPRLCAWARSRGLRVWFRVEPRGVPWLVEGQALARGRNAWGDPTASSGGCPSSPDLRELFRAALEELAAFGADGFQTAGWTIDAPPGPARGCPARPFDWHPTARRLLDVCLCESCRQVALTAGIDPDLVARSVRVHFERVAAAAPAETDERLAQDELLEGYRAARMRDLEGWLTRVAQRHAERACLHAVPFQPGLPVACPQGWRALGRFDGCVPRRDAAARPAALEDDVVEYAGRAGPRAAVALPAWRPRVRDSAELVRLMSRAASAGVASFDFEGLYESPPEALVWLRQALRYARRSA